MIERELHHVVESGGCGNGKEVGVAQDLIIQSSLQISPDMSINNPVPGPPLSVEVSLSHNSRRRIPDCLKKINKKHLFGLAMLLVVDLIWVGSAGLTKYLFKEQQYDKPIFTVYFKTILFNIYLLPFMFWRPWQRLCCKSCNAVSLRKKRQPVAVNVSDVEPTYRSSTYGSINYVSIDNKDDKFVCDDDDVSLKGKCIDSSSSYNNSYSSIDDGTITDELGPSEYQPIRFNDNEFDNNSLSLPRKVDRPSDRYLTSSTSVPLTRRKQTHIRFCQTVEVKHVHDSIITTETSLVTKEPDGPAPPVSVRTVMILALIFGILWFFANYFYAKSLETQSVAAVNTMSSLSGVFVLVLAAIPFPKLAKKDQFSLTKLLLVLISVSGAILIGVSHSSDHSGKVDVGLLFAIGGSCLYALYLVLLSKFVPDPDSLEVPMFFGFVGLLDAIILAPVLVSWHYFGLETFQLPPTNEVWTILLVNGFVGTVLSELLWLWGCLLTSSLVGTLSLSLVSPLSITYSIFVADASFSPKFFFGAALIVLAFVVLSILDHSSGWDPVWLLVKKIWNCYVHHNDNHGYKHLSKDSNDLLQESLTDSFNSTPPPI